MTEIVVIRHGETAWNVERRIQGNIDIPLNEEGRRQAKAVGRWLARESFDAVFSSDLRRAFETAEIVAASLSLEVNAEPALRERRFGAFEGLTHAEIKSRFPQAHAAWRARDPDAVVPAGEWEGESLRVFHERALGALTGLAQANAGRKIVAVTHGGVLDCLYRAATGMGFSDPRNFDILNAGINRLSWDGQRFHVKQWCAVDHLAETALDEL